MPRDPRTNRYPPEIRAKVVAAMLTEGLSAESAAARFGVSHSIAHKWFKADAPRIPRGEPDPDRVDEPPYPRVYRRTLEDLSDLVYDAVAESLKALLARAKITASDEWVRSQSAEGLARLNESQLAIARTLISGFRPVEPESTVGRRALAAAESGAADDADFDGRS